MPIRKHLKDHSAFEPDAIEAMSAALERTCSALHVNGHIRDREVIAARIIDLARNGVIDAEVLSDRVIDEGPPIALTLRGRPSWRARILVSGDRCVQLFNFEQTGLTEVS